MATKFVRSSTAYSKKAVNENLDPLPKNKTNDSKIYRNLYYIGFKIRRTSRRIFKGFSRKFSPVKHFFHSLFNRKIRRNAEVLRREIKAVYFELRQVKGRFKRAKSKGIMSAIAEPFKIISDTFIGHRRFYRKIFAIIAPIAAVFALILTVNFYLNMDYVLQVNYGDETVGIVENEDVYTKANEMIKERIGGTSGSVALNCTPTFKLAVANDDSVLEAREVCDNVLGLTDGEIEEAYGLVVNGNLIGAIRSEGDMQFILDDFLESHKEAYNYNNAQFIDDIEVEYGFFPVSNISSSDELKENITAAQTSIDYYTIKKGETAEDIADKKDMTVEELEQLNPNLDETLYEGARIKVETEKPVLGVKSLATNTYYQSIAFSTVKEKDSSKYTDYKVLKSAGINGKERFVEQITYIDGEEVSRTLIERVVEEEPVSAVYVVGTKARPQQTSNPSQNSSSVGKGKFAWPVPGVRSISSPYGMRWGKMHKGIDISTSGIRGRTIVAAAGGTVTAVSQTSGGYGLYVIISHSGGYSTLYAHCDSVSVSQGQSVSKGQSIATVGNTGNSTGPHLHFEIRVNGNPKNPMNYY